MNVTEGKAALITPPATGVISVMQCIVKPHLNCQPISTGICGSGKGQHLALQTNTTTTTDVIW
ncbi:hypothetical protein E2C01_046183 [Portunus trituberculatus]|uniref:Uncharacterized protein n=1 Tax=Portunus trituberculatus TaxID=210409 RepID=A0A5B7G580_PORTR|nr:hypothetical protein [Portunus trituberculatus]